jgi:hydrogenase nickel incorporation protein HypA/HybF
MHELSIALSIVEIAANEALQHNGDAVAVHVRLGALSGVVAESLRSAWELARGNSPLQRADLVIEEIPVVAYCPACDAEHGVVSLQQFCCSHCGAPVTNVLRGRELEVVALELAE